jgi:hypothetical protein
VNRVYSEKKDIANPYKIWELPMPRKSPCSLTLSPKEEKELLNRTSKYKLPYFSVVRERVILLAVQSLSNNQISAKLDSRREIFFACGENASLSYGLMAF